MATRRRPAKNDEEEEIPQPLPAGKPTIHDRIAAFTMLDGMDGEKRTQAEKSVRLSLVGFSNQDIARMLQTTAAVVATNLYSERKRAATKTAARKTTSAGGVA